MQTIKEKIKNVLNTPLFVAGTLLGKVTAVIGVCILVALVFLIGEAVGFHKARVSYQFGESYGRIFGEKNFTEGRLSFPEDNHFTESHGASGTIVKIKLPQVVVEARNGTEKIIVINNQTVIKKMRDTIASTTLALGDEIVVLGAPGTGGEINAGLIRLLETNQ